MHMFNTGRRRKKEKGTNKKNKKAFPLLPSVVAVMSETDRSNVT